MKPLRIDLQEGFNDDLVVVKVDNREVLRKEGVNTMMLLGYAENLTVQVPEGHVKVEVIMPKRGLSRMIELDISQDLYLGISVINGGIEYLISDTPFGYQ